MHVHWKHLAIFFAVLPFVGLLFAWIGFFNVGASTGHWKVTEWFLHFAMRSAIRTYALNVDVPEELPRHSIQAAAAHYARGCAMCHGAPGEPRTAVVLKMLPQPPDLAPAIDEWSDAQLFRIVKHGVRFTGMPAWPSQERDDEIWAMVAFLREYPAMQPARYRDLAYGRQVPALRPAGFEQTLIECGRCHGDEGQSHSPAVPLIAGQSEAYLLDSLRAYARGDRPSGVMSLAASAVDQEAYSALARHFATLPRGRHAPEGEDPNLVQKGEIIARNGIASLNVPACASCHEGSARNPHYPSIAGQPAYYLETQLKLFRSGTRGGTGYAHLMTKIAAELTDEHVQALAAYFASKPRQ